tara:strand:- start:47 stop:529 length:483 start_codon:yes stop_codon:yes gene_type:complete
MAFHEKPGGKRCGTLNEWPHNSIFLAGGITGCEDWQDRAFKLLDESNTNLVVFNPRRDDFDVTDKKMGLDQIKWERDKLKQTGSILFWFSHETVQPITLFELGKCLQWDKPLFIGADRKYERREDILIQVALEKNRLHVHDTLEGVLTDFQNWRRYEQQN